MARCVWLIAVAAVALSGCGSSPNETENATPKESSVGSVSVQESAPPKVPLPQISVSCNNPNTGNEVLRLVTDPSSENVYVHNIVDDINENRYSQKSTSYEIDGDKLIFFSEFAKKDDPNRVSYDLTTGRWSEENGYNPQKRKDAEACEAREQAERSDCAEAANIDACVATRYPGMKGMCYVGAGLSTMIERQCTPLDNHTQVLEAAKTAWKNSVDYWNENP